MKHVALAALLLAACGSKHPPIANRGSGSAPVKRSEPVRLTLVEGTPQTLGDGTVLRLGKVLYAHLADGKNLSMATITVSESRIDGASKEIVLERVDQPASSDVAGWRITLEAADPYHQPSSATITVEPVP